MNTVCYTWRGRLNLHMNRFDDWSGDSPWAIPIASALTSTCHKLFTARSDGKESACSAGGPGSIPGLVRSPGEGNDNRLQDSCLENPMDRGACGATVHGVTKSQTRQNAFHSIISCHVLLTVTPPASLLGVSFSPWEAPGPSTG